ncbi:hypothetical protein CYK37_20655 [Mesorhizobium loti]|nr:hypothetical protein CYK37_20655 [Mesorhizobium loti]
MLCAMGQGYIERSLQLGDTIISEEELLSKYEIVLVLAEPGAGKSELLRSLAARTDTAPIRASLFRHREILEGAHALVIDALDELAKIDQSAIDQVIEKARATGASSVVMASRSSEWDTQRTHLLKEAFGIEPAVIRLQPFTREEQKALYEQHVPGEDFVRFSEEVERFGLSPLLGNPQFLKLFADAYVRRGRQLVSKRQIFVDAIEKLASESSSSEWQRSRPPIERIVAIAEELFAKTMLAGASGLSVADSGDRDFPYLFSLCAAETGMVSLALNTRLFKPTNELSNHEPVHRIVAEYCAARYLVRRAEDKADNLVLNRVLSVVAPSNVVRDELRGLLGWIASLGNPQTQEACIRIDPYAVLANGDPSQLSSSSKRLLLKALQELSEVDPYFRRSDAWRRFSVAGLLTPEIVVDVRKALSGSGTSSDLRNLLLELLDGSSIASQLADTLRDIVLDTSMDIYTRIRAQRILIGFESYNHTSLTDALVGKGDSASLRLAVESVGVLSKSTELSTIIALLRAVGKKTSKRPHEESESRFNLRYQSKQMIAGFDFAITVALLDDLTNDLQCTCGRSRSYQCECRPGLSKIVGSLLDRYFELADGPYDPQRIWRWTQHLIFPDHQSPENSTAIKRLQEEDGLRRAIYLIAMAELPNKQTVWEARTRFWSSDGHAGLRMKTEDLFAITSEAFATGNLALWAGFYASHNIWSENKGPDPLRAHLRKHARGDPRFSKVWADLERWSRKHRFEQQDRWPRRQRRWQLRESAAKENRARFFRENRARIEAGQHWGALREIADCYLVEPEKLAEFLDDIATADIALCNAFALLAPHTPTLAKLSADRLVVTRVLHAACLATFRRERTLEHVDHDVLRAVKTDVGGYPGYHEDEGEAFEAEIDRLILSGDADAEAFARAFIEPQLLHASEAATDVSWLKYKAAFRNLRAHLPLEWLTRFPSMPHNARDTLFDLAAEHGDRVALNTIISSRCEEGQLEQLADAEGKRSPASFWLLRGFFFLTDPPEPIWAYLRSSPRVLLSIEHFAGRTSHDDYRGWPTLSANKVFCILDIFIDVWPKVYLPSSWGSHSPDGETAYRFLTEVIYTINRDEPQNAIATLDRILADPRFSEFHAEAKSLKAASMRKRALQVFEPPSVAAVNELLNHNRLASVEDLRTVLVQDLSDYQTWLCHAETNPLSVFYPGGTRLDENGCRDRIVDHLDAQMRARNLSVVIEQHFADSNRCDIAAAAMIDGARRLLVVEVKGQWHRELFTAASAQLHERYSSHPDAAQQGIYLVLWFGPGETLAGRQTHEVKSPAELKDMIEQRIPPDIRGMIDVVVLDLSLKSRA